MFGVFQIWWRDPGSNWGHTDFQSVALPTELSRRWGVLNNLIHKPSSIESIKIIQQSIFTTKSAYLRANGCFFTHI